MAKHSLQTDQTSKKIIRYLLVFQIATFLPLIVLALTGLSRLVVIIDILDLVIFAGILFWLYIRYSSDPLVQEKHLLQKQTRRLKNQINDQENKIRFCNQTRESLKQ